MKILIRLICLMGLFACLPFAKGGIEPAITGVIPGTDLLPTNNPVVDIDLSIPGYSSISFNSNWMQDFDLVQVTNLLKLYSNQNAEVYINFGYKLTVPLNIVYYESTSATPNPITGEQLEINYDPTPGAEYQQMDVFRFVDGCQIEVQINPADIIITDLQGGPLTAAQVTTVSQIINVQTDLIVERYYHFDPSDQLCPANFACTASNTNLANELVICWDPIFGAEAYDLEWIFVDDYDGNGGFLPASSLTYDFNQNAARAQITETSYAVPLVYEHGYLLYRVRGIGRNPANFSKPLIGVWSCGYSTCPVSCQSSSGNLGLYQTKIPINSHENDHQNWQAITSYAENGKRKDVISYYDGTMRNRQSVTGLSTDRMTLVGEAYYDHQGREAVQALPIPVNNATLKFYNNFNQNQDGTPYNRENFDITQPGCVAAAGPMLNTHKGASHYYSPNNPDLTGINAFIPDAEGFPFTQTTFMPDNTGRIARQGGVGNMHQIDSGHESKFFYGTPFQEELDRMFGNHVGYSEHYKKNMVIDPNGQISISYLDAKGNTIATSLAGNPPENVSPLNSYTKQKIYIDLMDSNVQDDQNYSLISHNTHLVNTQSIYEFHYTMDGLKYKDQNCMAANVCYDCVYDLNIKIVDDLNCGEVVYEHSETIGKLFIPKLDPITGNPIFNGKGPELILNTFCIYSAGPYNINNPPQPEYGSADLPFSVTLDVGSYTIIKELTVNEAAADAYVDHFINDPSNICTQTFEDFLAEELANIDTAACHIECGDAQDDLADANYMASLSNDEVDELNSLMSDLCDQSLNQCQTIREAMLADVSPMGQYGYVPINGLAPAHAFDPVLSVFTENNELPEGLWYKDPPFVFNDQNGNQMMIQNTSGLMVPVNHASIPLDVFIDNWQDEWAEVLLELHPEKCYLDFCEQYLGPSESFDANLITTNTLSEAINNGYINQNSFNAIRIADPFFNINFPFGPSSNTLQLLMDGKISIYASDPNSSQTISLQELAITLANCPNTPQNCSANVNGPMTQDEEWQIYRTLYLSAKEELLHKLRTEFAIANGCYNGCIGATPFNIQQDNFWDPFDQYHPNYTGDPWTNTTPPDDHYCNNYHYFLLC